MTLSMALIGVGLCSVVFLGLGLGVGHWLGFRAGREDGVRHAISELHKERRALEKRQQFIRDALGPSPSSRTAVIAPTASLRSQARVDDKSR